MCGELSVALAGREQPQYLELALGEKLDRGVVLDRSRPLGVLLDHSPGNGRREERVAGGDDAHGLDEILGQDESCERACHVRTAD